MAIIDSVIVELTTEDSFRENRHNISDDSLILYPVEKQIIFNGTTYQALPEGGRKGQVLTSDEQGMPVWGTSLDNQPFIVVDKLPDKPEEGNEGKLHLMLNPDGGEDNLYDEYLWVKDKWEKLGTAKIEVDLNNYPTFNDIATNTKPGVVKSSTTGTTANRDYKVQVNTDGTMKVNVPWVDVSYRPADIMIYVKPDDHYQITNATTSLELYAAFQDGTRYTKENICSLIKPFLAPGTSREPTKANSYFPRIVIFPCQLFNTSAPNDSNNGYRVGYMSYEVISVQSTSSKGIRLVFNALTYNTLVSDLNTDFTFKTYYIDIDTNGSVTAFKRID